MATISHESYVSLLSEKELKKLKQICQAWTSLDGGLYILTHSDLNQDACPICQTKSSS